MGQWSIALVNDLDRCIPMRKRLAHCSQKIGPSWRLQFPRKTDRPGEATFNMMQACDPGQFFRTEVTLLPGNRSKPDFEICWNCLERRFGRRQIASVDAIVVDRVACQSRLDGCGN